MTKIKIGNLTHNRKRCNCGNTAEYFIFLLESDNKSIHYKCKSCAKQIKEIIDTIELTIKN